MSIANQQTLAESGAEGRPLILEKGSYVPWASQFLRFLDNKRGEGELIRNSIDNGPYIRKEIVDLKDDTKKILELIKDISVEYKNQYYADIKFVAEDGESLASVYERFSTLINIMDRNEIKTIEISINTKFQFEPHVKASKAKKAARNHDPLALVENSYAIPSYSHASPSYSLLPQPYYVTHPLYMIDYDVDYQGEIQADTQEDKLSTAMMLLA
ncbi:hypothetical protein Tco_1533297 [Tanacetum coccineum]